MRKVSFLMTAGLLTIAAMLTRRQMPTVVLLSLVYGAITLVSATESRGFRRVMAISGGAEVAHEYAKYHTVRVGFWRVLVAICFTITFAWFGISSFWKVWKKGKRGSR